jgi:hypothetical protein
MTKIADPHQNVMDPEHWGNVYGKYSLLEKKENKFVFIE